MVSSVRNLIIWISHDETASQNWKTAVNPDKSKSVCKRFMNSQGKIFQNRIDAMKYLSEDEEQNKDDLEVMANGLVADGLVSATFLPPGWKMKKFTNETDRARRYRKMYLSDKFDVLRSLESVLVYMKENHVSEKDILKFKEGCLNKWKKDPSLPEGWMHSESIRGKTYLSPNGKWFGSLYQVLRHFNNSEEFTVKDVENVKTLMLTEGWSTVEYLPPEWMVKKRCDGLIYVTPTLEKFSCARDVVKFMLKENYD